MFYVDCLQEASVGSAWFSGALSRIPKRSSISPIAGIAGQICVSKVWEQRVRQAVTGYRLSFPFLKTLPFQLGNLFNEPLHLLHLLPD